jgi:hypothetical protein
VFISACKPAVYLAGSLIGCMSPTASHVSLIATLGEFGRENLEHEDWPDWVLAVLLSAANSGAGFAGYAPPVATSNALISAAFGLPAAAPSALAY